MIKPTANSSRRHSIWSAVCGLLVILLVGSCSSSSGPDNLAPRTPPIPTGPLLALINQPTTYSANASDPDNNLATLTFFWDGQESTAVTLAQGATSAEATHIYTKLGSFQIFIVATDDAGLLSDSSSGLRINVIEPGPLPPTLPDGSDTTFLNQNYTYTSAAILPDGDSLFMIFSWGDGDSTLTGWDTSAALFSANHIYYDTGTFVIRVRAIDDSGRISLPSLGRTIRSINRSPLKPSTPLGPQTAIVSEEVIFRSATADPEGDLFSMSFQWGDGVFSKTALAAGDRQFTATHQYADTGMFAVRVSATDLFGNISDTSQITMLHVPIFPSDTIQFINSALDKQLVTVQQSWSVTWINRDQGIVHTIVADDSILVNTNFQPIFGTRFLKIDDADKVTFETIGLFPYHCEDHPFDDTEKGRVRVR